MSGQCLTNPKVRAGYGYRDPWPVADMPAYRRERLNRTRLGALYDRCQVADDTARPVGQSELDRLGQIVNDIPQLARCLENHDLADEVASEAHLDAAGRTAGWLLRTGCWFLRERVGRRAGAVG
ncbi:MAG TPA: hypothetical protein VES02_12270 [Dermatophilaceae bacterium]|nr:hypothetical protein [Dermatophilaceae bacterium]